MTPYIFNKFNKFVVYPDLYNKFLLLSINNFPLPKEFMLYLRYIFSNRVTYNYIGLKALVMLMSIYPKRSLLISRIISLRFTRTRCFSSVFVPLTLAEASSFISFTSKKPMAIDTFLNNYIRESTYFVFPGYNKPLRFPSWVRTVNISFNQSSQRNLYTFLFYKTMYFD
jgi:hypothetical protein